jgi:hypothetical protein
VRGQEGDRAVSRSIQPWEGRATRQQTPWCAGERGVLVMVARLPRLLGGLQDALPEEGEAGPAIALALEPLQPGDLPLHGAVAPVQGEPGGDRGQVLLPPTGKAGQRVDAAVGGLRDSGLQVPAPALPDHGEKGLRQPICPRDTGCHLAALVQIGLRLSGPLDGRAHHDACHRPGRRPLRAGIGRALGLRGLSHVGGPSQPGEEAAHGPSGVRGAEGLHLTPELDAIGVALAPAVNQVGEIRRQHPRGWPPLELSRAGRGLSPEVGVDGRAAHAQPARDGGQRHPLRPERVHGFIDGDPAGVPGRPCGPLPRRRLRVPAPSPVPGCAGDRARGRHARQRRADRCRLEHRSVVDQDGFQGLAEVMDEMKPIDHLHSIGQPAVAAVRIQVTPIAANHRHRGMLGQPGRHRCRGPVRQEVHHAMTHQIDQDGTIAVAPPPVPLVDPDGLQGGGDGHRGRPYQAEQGGLTGCELQAGRQPNSGLPAEGDAERLQDCEASWRFPSIWRDELWEALRA